MKARFTYINKRQSDFAISRGFYFHETSHMRSFAKIKSSRKFPNLQYMSHDTRFPTMVRPAKLQIMCMRAAKALVIF